MSPKVLIDKAVNFQMRSGAAVKNGVVTLSGDATVPLISLGYMCIKGWKNPRFNPAGGFFR
jgi:hypothetical protein